MSILVADSHSDDHYVDQESSASLNLYSSVHHPGSGDVYWFDRELREETEHMSQS